MTLNFKYFYTLKLGKKGIRFLMTIIIGTAQSWQKAEDILRLPT